jgi:hypothetical protein
MVGGARLRYVRGCTHMCIHIVRIHTTCVDDDVNLLHATIGT